MSREPKKHFASFRVILLSLCMLAAIPAHAATLIVVNQDGPGEGLNDPAAFTPKGGNAATTLGDARMRAVRFAASLLGNILESPVPIQIGVKFDPLGGTSTGAGLGHGGPAGIFHDFPGAPVANTWYPAALANKLAGEDLDDTEIDVELVFNSDVDGPVVLGAAKFYYGFDAAAPAEDPSLVTVAVHEILHGLGFSTALDEATGAKLQGLDDVFSLHLERTGATPSDFPSMTDAQRLAAFTAGPEVHWVGTEAAAASTILTAGVAAGGKIEMHAPGPTPSPGALVHFSSNVAPFQTMKTQYGGIDLDLRIARAVLADLGWGPGPGCVTIQTP